MVGDFVKANVILMVAQGSMIKKARVHNLDGQVQDVCDSDMDPYYQDRRWPSSRCSQQNLLSLCLSTRSILRFTLNLGFVYQQNVFVILFCKFWIYIFFSFQELPLSGLHEIEPRTRCLFKSKPAQTESASQSSSGLKKQPFGLAQTGFFCPRPDQPKLLHTRNLMCL